MSLDDWQEQLRRGTLELAVLLVLAPAPRYGLEIIRRLEVADLVLAEGTVYPLLARLEREGLLRSTRVEGEGPRPRKYYQLTAAGRSRMKKMGESFRALSSGVERMIESEIGRQS